jgi:hypothetical protein
MRSSRFPRFSVLALSAATFAAGCDLAVPSAPSTTPPAQTTDTFEGSFTFLGADSHQFTIKEAGSVQVRLTAVGPLTTMALGVSVGAWNGSVCQGTNIKNDNSRVSVLALNGTSAPGDYCVTVYDSGNLPTDATATYTVTVIHP